MTHIEELEKEANKRDATIYNICHRTVGWAVQWHEANRQGDSKDFKNGLIVYNYYDTFDDAILGELERIKRMQP